MLCLMDCCRAPDLVRRCWGLECLVQDWARGSERLGLGLAIALDLASPAQGWAKSVVDMPLLERQEQDWAKSVEDRRWAQG